MYFVAFKVNCSRLSGFQLMTEEIAKVVMTGMTEEEKQYLGHIFDSCFVLQGSHFNNASSMSLPRVLLKNTVQNLTREEVELKVQPTWLRSNPIYYRVYYVHMNTIFASSFDMFFNSLFPDFF